MNDKNIVGYEVHTLDIMVKHTIDALSEADGLTRMQSWLIRHLYEHRDENIFQKDVEALFGLPRSTASGILQGMEKQGFLRREPVSSDARLKRLVLTEKAISYQLTVMQDLDDTEELLKTDIDPAKLDIFFDVIRQMKQNLQQGKGCRCCK